ncbi:unnamed protein product, partial [Ectocarpus sp. 6 AP-2014]
AVYSNPWSHRRASPPAVLRLQFLKREEFSTLFPLCTHELALSTWPGVEGREKLTLQEKLAYAGIRTPDLTSRRFRRLPTKPPGRPVG